MPLSAAELEPESAFAIPSLEQLSSQQLWLSSKRQPTRLPQERASVHTSGSSKRAAARAARARQLASQLPSCQRRKTSPLPLAGHPQRWRPMQLPESWRLFLPKLQKMLARQSSQSKHPWERRHRCASWWRGLQKLTAQSAQCAGVGAAAEDEAAAAAAEGRQAEQQAEQPAAVEKRLLAAVGPRQALALMMQQVQTQLVAMIEFRQQELELQSFEQAQSLMQSSLAAAHSDPQLSVHICKSGRLCFPSTRDECIAHENHACRAAEEQNRRRCSCPGRSHKCLLQSLSLKEELRPHPWRLQVGE